MMKKDYKDILNFKKNILKMEEKYEFETLFESIIMDIIPNIGYLINKDKYKIEINKIKWYKIIKFI